MLTSILVGVGPVTVEQEDMKRAGDGNGQGPAVKCLAGAIRHF